MGRVDLKPPRSPFVAMHFAPSSVLVPTSKAPVTTSVALVPSSFLLLVVRPGAPRSVLVTSSEALVTRSDALVPSSKKATSSNALCY